LLYASLQTHLKMASWSKTNTVSCWKFHALRMWSFRFLRISLSITSRIWPCICEEMDWNLLEKCGPWMWSLEVWRIFTSWFRSDTSQLQVWSFNAYTSLLSQHTSDRMHRLHMYLPLCWKSWQYTQLEYVFVMALHIDGSAKI